MEKKIRERFFWGVGRGFVVCGLRFGVCGFDVCGFNLRTGVRVLLLPIKIKSC
jgi:hypothetical protein